MRIIALLLTLLLSLTAYAETKCDDISLFRAVDQSQLSFWERAVLKNEIMKRCWGQAETRDTRQRNTGGTRQSNASDWEKNMDGEISDQRNASDWEKNVYGEISELAVLLVVLLFGGFAMLLRESDKDSKSKRDKENALKKLGSLRG